ncbi:(2Fe-2S)-binding protein [Streptomyces huiliensis]|uniref:(2Fe-2S)-binding protein n=1 Tax=Streptomyces huiliensis TaxID=2876027 RepID=UPI001CBCDC4A|nr:(2Fe-2S)-binding protein [Streptomyces huiliensis]MBZ4322513.1 (2Fe-2S)-binding protein [Streptomyces huiliensis]
MHLPELASVGPFFALRTDDDELGGPGPGGYLPLGEEVVRLRVETVGRRLGTEDGRVAASVAFQGIAGRVLSVALGAAVLVGRVPDLAGGGLRWNPLLTAPDDLWLPDAPLLPPGADVVGGIVGSVIEGCLVPLHDLVRAAVPVSSRVLWGNAGSSVGGALRVLHGWCGERGRDEEGARALGYARELLEHPLLAGTGGLSVTAGGPAFVRTTCCLYYRVPSGGGMCGDCVLRHPPRAAGRGPSPH